MCCCRICRLADKTFHLLISIRSQTWQNRLEIQAELVSHPTRRKRKEMRESLEKALRELFSSSAQGGLYWTNTKEPSGVRRRGGNQGVVSEELYHLSSLTFPLFSSLATIRYYTSPRTITCQHQFNAVETDSNFLTKCAPQVKNPFHCNTG